MKAKLLSIPDPIEWDFRRIPECDLGYAWPYEYARTSESIQQTIRKAKRIGQYPEGGLMPSVILAWYPDFPKPWKVTEREASGQRTSRITAEPMPQFLERAGNWMQLTKLHRDSVLERLSKATRESLLFGINFDGATVDEIIDDFEKWLRVEAKKHASEMKSRGQAGQLQLAPLKDLAALRLSKAKLTFEQIQLALRVYLDSSSKMEFSKAKRENMEEARRSARIAGIDVDSIPSPPSQKAYFTEKEILPIFKNHSTFSGALERAKARLEALV